MKGNEILIPSLHHKDEPCTTEGFIGYCKHVTILLK